MLALRRSKIRDTYAINRRALRSRAFYLSSAVICLGDKQKSRSCEKNDVDIGTYATDRSFSIVSLVTARRGAATRTSAPFDSRTYTVNRCSSRWPYSRRMSRSTVSFVPINRNRPRLGTRVHINESSSRCERKAAAARGIFIFEESSVSF